MIPMPINIEAQEILAVPKATGIGASGSTTKAFQEALAKLDPTERRQKATEAATQLVSTAFILPILEDMQEGFFRAEMFAANTVEKRFAPLLNQRIADSIAIASNFPLVEALVNRLVGPEVSNEEKPADDKPSKKEAVDVTA